MIAVLDVQSQAQQELDSYLIKQAKQITRNREFLSLKEKKAIAGVISWDACRTIYPSEIITIRMEGDFAFISLTGKRLYPIHKEQFKGILNRQKAS